jgi:hypothetical protein
MARSSSSLAGELNLAVAEAAGANVGPDWSETEGCWWRRANSVTSTVAAVVIIVPASAMRATTMPESTDTPLPPKQ